MPIDSNIPMRGVAVDTATPIYQAQQQTNQNQDQANKNAMATQKVLDQHYQKLDTREKSRLTSTIAGAAQLKTFLDNEDIRGAESFLMSRKQTLSGRMGSGEGVDTQETDAALQMLQSGNIDELRNNVDGLIAAGQVYGIIDKTLGGGATGGATGELITRLMDANPGMSEMQALQAIKGGAGQEGRNLADIGSGTAANYATQAGVGQADLEFKPQIARESSQATAEGTRLGGNVADYQDFMASVPALENTANTLYAIADRATYTMTGQAANAFQRQLGFNPGDDAAARSYYTNLIRDEILPILKATFGGQFSVEEGKWLLATLGDANASPIEKKAAIQARVDSWKNHVNTLAARAQQPAPDTAFQSFPPQGTTGPAIGSNQRITVSNGQESFEIDAGDLAEAQAEGFNPLR